MKPRCFIPLTLALALLAGLGFNLTRNAAWAQSPQDLAGTWVIGGDDYFVGEYGCGEIECAYCGEGDYFKLETDGSYLQLTKLGQKVSGVPEYEGLVLGNRVEGKAFMDHTMWENGTIYYRPITGTISDGGRTMTLTFDIVLPGGSYGLLVEKWLTFRAICTFTRAD